MLPLELNTRLRCRWKDGEFYRAKVLERRMVQEFASDPHADPARLWQYYVHFSGSECQRTPPCAKSCMRPHCLLVSSLLPWPS